MFARACVCVKNRQRFCMVWKSAVFYVRWLSDTKSVCLEATMFSEIGYIVFLLLALPYIESGKSKRSYFSATHLQIMEQFTLPKEMCRKWFEWMESFSARNYIYIIVFMLPFTHFANNCLVIVKIQRLLTSNNPHWICKTTSSTFSN